MYFDLSMWVDRRVEEKLKAIHDYNSQQAKAAGLTLEQWHEKMSEIGNKPLESQGNLELSPEEIALASARWSGDYHRKILGNIGFGSNKK